MQSSCTVSGILAHGRQPHATSRPEPSQQEPERGPTQRAIRPTERASVLGLIAVTDFDWFRFLSLQPSLDEVNFWRPSDTRKPRQLRPGTPVLFKLRKSHGGWIVGFGVFARHDVKPAWLVWECFLERNGAANFEEMRSRIERLRHEPGSPGVRAGDYEIGCLMLAQPVFFAREHWVKPPQGWPENAVQGKAYDLAVGEGARVWNECLAHAAKYPSAKPALAVGDEEAPRYGAEQLIKPRLGQGIFRLAVTDAYGSACAVTAEHSLPALEAAHIRPFADGGPHEISNGLLLRSDIHRLFDRGYVGVTPDFRFVVSRRLKDDFSNGKSYYPLHEQLISLPLGADERPSPELLRWHMEHLFRE